MIAVALLALQALDTKDPSHVPTSVLVISAIFSGLGLIITAAGAVWIQRGQKAARSAEVRIGEPTGQRDLVTMIATTQRMMADHATDFADFRREVGARFDGMHKAIVVERERGDRIENRLSDVEDRR